MGSLPALRTSGHDLVGGEGGLPCSICRPKIEIEAIKGYSQGYLDKSEVESESWKECKGLSGQIIEGEEENRI